MFNPIFMKKIFKNAFLGKSLTFDISVLHEI